MGKDPCPICATPKAKYIADRFQCKGCGIDCQLSRLLKYLGRARKVVTFDRATELYERTKLAVSFGQWIMQRNLELTAKP